MATILTIDLGKFQSQACFYQVADGSHEFKRIASTPAALQDLLAERKVDRVVIEVCAMAGWIVEIAQSLGVAIQVVNCNQGEWRWKNVKYKSDKSDALKLARLSALNQLSLVHMPSREVRQWRSLVQYRQTLVRRRTAISNSIHALLLGAGEAAVKRLDSERAIAVLDALAKALDECPPQQLWRGQLHCELTALRQVRGLLEQVEAKLDQLAAEDQKIKLLRTIPGVGPRLAEMVVVWIDDPARFRTGRQVGSYAGLTPRRFQSGESDRRGRISKAGCASLRKLLVEVAWGMLQHNPRAREVYSGLCKGQKTRRKQAAIALARRILVWCWAMLRDNRVWDEKHQPALAV